jgi:hypothetical protein
MLCVPLAMNLLGQCVAFGAFGVYVMNMMMMVMYELLVEWINACCELLLFKKWWTTKYMVAVKQKCCELLLYVW